MRPPVFAVLLQVLILAIFAEDRKPIPVVDVSDSELDELAKKHEFVLALFYSEKTEKLEGVKKALAQVELVGQQSLMQNLQIVKVKNSKRVTEHGFRSLPKILFFRKDLPILYDVDVIQVEDLIPWMEMNRDINIKTLADDTFEHLTQASTGATTGDWFVMFYQKKCSGIIPSFEAAASRLKHKMVFARVDVSTNPKLEKRFNIKKCPSIKLFKQGSMYSYDLASKDVKILTAFVETSYQSARKQPVPVEQSPFDAIVEDIVFAIRSRVKGPRGTAYIMAAAGGALFLLILIFCCCCRGDGRRRPKFD